MDSKARRALNGHYNALLGFQQTLADYAKNTKAHVIDAAVVDQFEAEMTSLQRDFADIAPVFNRLSFVAHDVGRGAYYKVTPMQAFIALVIGKVEAALPDDDDDRSGDPVVQVRYFAYVADGGLRSILQRDYQEIQRAYAASCWKSVIILSGGAIETLLLDALKRDPASAAAAKAAPSKGDISRWDLADLIEVAVELEVVGGGVNKLSHSVREFRNLIHPGNEVRSKLVFGQEEARIALEVLNIVDRELSR